MDIKYNIKRDKLDGSDWLVVGFTAVLTGYDPSLDDHESITELKMLRHKHNLNGGSSLEPEYEGDEHPHRPGMRYIADHMNVYIENPTPEFETDFQYWILKT